MPINYSRRRFVTRAAAAGILTSSVACVSHVAPVSSHSQETRDLLDLLGMQYPIVQAPTGGVVGSELTAAVANCGALGALPLSWSSAESAKKSIANVMRKTSGPFFVNFVLSFRPVALQASLDSGVRIVQFSWGMPDPATVKMIRSAGAVMGIQVTSKKSAQKAIALGADYLVCQGTEAGGHVHASMPLDNALEEVVATSGRIPVLASGGIANGQKMFDCMKLGAAGVVMGSRFVASTEAAAHRDYKDALVVASAKDTVMTNCMNKGWDNATHRILRNSTFEAWESEGCPQPGARPGESDRVVNFGDKQQHSVERYSINSPGKQYIGNIEAMAAYAGKGVDNITQILSAAEIVRLTWQEFMRASQ